jgi:GMP synthase (glutamine-hydrolysing)
VTGHELVLILDFGSQYTQLIARRIRELGVYSEIRGPETGLEQVMAMRPRGIVLSGGPASVYDEGAPRVDPSLFGTGVPVLGICYGMQAMMQALGGTVGGGAGREYGPAVVEVLPESIFRGLPSRMQVWMSHGDHTTALPPGFRCLARSGDAPFAAVQEPARGLVGVQFHPEVAHTEHGEALLRAFLYGTCGCRGDWSMREFCREEVERIRAVVRDGRALMAVSGGVDSAVTALLLHRALGDRLTCLFLDNGLLRLEEGREVRTAFQERFHLEVRHRDASERFMEALRGVSDPEEKRRRVGETFVRVFEEEAAALGDVGWLGQGTLYPDVIESGAVIGPSQTIKTHHNVGGLPERMGLQVIEPLRMLFKDEARELGRELGLDEGFLRRHPFPGPGLAVRVLGEVTRERCDRLRRADRIFLKELRRADWYDRCSQAFVVLLPVRTVGVMGDRRTYEEVVALRAVTTRDFMTADWTRLPEDLLARVATRIVNEIPGINRVVHDVTSKPPGTIEWE